MKRDEAGGIRVGDRAIADGRRVGGTVRIGEVVEVLGEPGHQRCRVQWEDGHETFVYRGADVRFEHRQPGAVERARS